MMKKTLLSLALSAFVLLAFAQVDDTKSKEILNKASKQLKAYKDVSIKFTYSMDNDVYDVHEEKKGSAMMKGEMYRIELAGQIMMSDGKTIWTYLPGSKEVQVANAEGDDENNPLKILSNWQENYRSKYIRTDVVSGHTIDIIDLVPKEGKSYFKIRLRIDQKSKQLVSSTIYDKNSTTYTYVIEEFKTNTDVSDSQFRFDTAKHPDVEVIDLR